MWIARKAQKVKRDGKIVSVKPGDPIPEAENWPNRQSWVRQKFIQWIDRPELVKVPEPEPVTAHAAEDIPELSEEASQVNEDLFEEKPKKKSKKSKKRS